MRGYIFIFHNLYVCVQRSGTLIFFFVTNPAIFINPSSLYIFFFDAEVAERAFSGRCTVDFWFFKVPLFNSTYK
jgi:hypothetical protein